MANIVRREGEQRMAPTAVYGFDPFSLMREMLSYDPLRQLDAFGQGGVSTWTPQFEVKETSDAYVIKADLPGVNQDDIDINLTGNRLIVSGRREAEERHEGDNYFAFERSYGTFTRAFTLPEGVDPDQVQAELKNGVLTLTIPKREEVKPRKISLKGVVEKVKDTLGAGDKADKGEKSERSERGEKADKNEAKA